MLPATLPRTVVVLALLLGLAACADAPSTPAAAPVDTRAVDIAYAQGMIPHHEQALELSALARGRAASPDLADLADLAFRIDRDQVEELGQLQGLLRAWGQDPAAGGGMAMTGMADPATLERLRTSSGPAFNRLWLETMVAHHRGALEMARGHLAAAGPESALREFSRTLLIGQQAEIDRMTGLLAS